MPPAICPGATLIVEEHVYYPGATASSRIRMGTARRWSTYEAKLWRPLRRLFEWVGGTGKYTGIKGTHTLNGGFIGAGPQGYALWKGEWRLP